MAHQLLIRATDKYKWVDGSFLAWNAIANAVQLVLTAGIGLL